MNIPRQTHSLDGFPAAAIRFVRALERNREKIADDYGLSASDLRAMFWVAEHYSVTPKALATHLQMTTGGVTVMTNRLVKQNLLQRVAHPNDRRSLFLELTGNGHEMMRTIHSDFKRMIGASTTGLTAPQLDAFETALETVAGEVSTRTARAYAERTAQTPLR